MRLTPSTKSGEIGSNRLTQNTRNYFEGHEDRDLIHGMGGNDDLYGGSEADSVYGDDGNDSVYGDAGNDKVYGGNGVDGLFGGLDNDAMYGGKGNDYMEGNEGRDNLFGGEGNDRLVGGIGKDQLTGGKGADVFVFSSITESGLGTNQDTITDFKSGQDKIDIDALGASLVFIGTNAFSGAAGEVRFDSTAKVLQIDVFGTGSADASIQLNSSVLVAGDLIL